MFHSISVLNPGPSLPTYYLPITEMFHGLAIRLNYENLNAHTCSTGISGDSKSTTWGRVGKVDTKGLDTSYVSLR